MTIVSFSVIVQKRREGVVQKKMRKREAGVEGSSSYPDKCKCRCQLWVSCSFLSSFQFNFSGVLYQSPCLPFGVCFKPSSVDCCACRVVCPLVFNLRSMTC